MASKLPCSAAFAAPVRINVGGKHLETSLNTLTIGRAKNSDLAACFASIDGWLLVLNDDMSDDRVSGYRSTSSSSSSSSLTRDFLLFHASLQHISIDLPRDVDGRIFIDRDPAVFERLLLWLRTGVMDEHSPMHEHVKAEVRYWKVS